MEISEVLLNHFRRTVVGLIKVEKEAVFLGANLYRRYVKRVAFDKVCSESNFTFSCSFCSEASFFSLAPG